MRCVISCGSTSFPWLVLFFGALLWGSAVTRCKDDFVTAKLVPCFVPVKVKLLLQSESFPLQDCICKLQMLLCSNKYFAAATREGRKHGALRPQKPLRLFRDGKVGGGGVRNFISNTYSLHCHHQNDSALRWAAVRAISMFH